MILETPQNIAIRKGFALREEGRGRSPKEARLGFLILAALGMLIFLLSGCGSDSTPKDAASGKKAKADKSGVTMRAVTPLLSPNAGGTAPPIPQLEKIPGLPSMEELEAKRTEAKKAYEKLDPKQEVLPGLTKEQLEAKIAAQRAKKVDPTQQILPGLTMEQLDAKRKEFRERPSTPGKVVHGLSEAQVKAKVDQERQMQEREHRRPEDMFPPK
jgi:hypothetical protein